MGVPRGLFAATNASRRARACRRSCSELERLIRQRFHAGSLTPDDALNLFDELLPQARPASRGAINLLLTVVSRAPSSSSVRDGPTLAVSLFNRMAREGNKNVVLDLCTHSIIIGCFCRMGRLDLGFAAFGKILKAGWQVNAIIFTNLLRSLCAEKKTSEAMDIVLRRMPELGCTPNVFSYSILLKGLCDKKESQEALKLLYMMIDNAGSCPPDVVSYSTVVDGFFKEGEVEKAYSLFQKMLDEGISPDVVTYTSMIDGLCKAQATDWAEEVLQQMLDNEMEDAKKLGGLLILWSRRG
ncbi:hypothetical protein PR202_gb07130 [Eleusine coracana subsp. coracana]|uniref:Pentatricopeptide repeat-containing protein n=1 Tax=Eleusine coracana subsp. coracana TaxID=191504 RepID=A0AAV5EB51_ELECO|nr:hypothetical protein PR202_gb07130 [Eleusine coracana subsp. coracana]